MLHPIYVLFLALGIVGCPPAAEPSTNPAPDVSASEPIKHPLSRKLAGLLEAMKGGDTGAISLEAGNLRQSARHRLKLHAWGWPSYFGVVGPVAVRHPKADPIDVSGNGKLLVEFHALDGSVTEFAKRVVSTRDGRSRGTIAPSELPTAGILVARVQGAEGFAFLPVVEELQPCVSAVTKCGADDPMCSWQAHERCVDGSVEGRLGTRKFKSFDERTADYVHRFSGITDLKSRVDWPAHDAAKGSQAVMNISARHDNVPWAEYAWLAYRDRPPTRLKVKVKERTKSHVAVAIYLPPGGVDDGGVVMLPGPSPKRTRHIWRPFPPAQPQPPIPPSNPPNPPNPPAPPDARDLMEVCRDPDDPATCTPECSVGLGNFARVCDCYNLALPERPSITRRLSSLPVQGSEESWLTASAQEHQHLPPYRTSNDGRLVMESRFPKTKLYTLRPELLSNQSVVASRKKTPSDPSSPLLNAVGDPTDLPGLVGVADGAGVTLCDASGGDDTTTYGTPQNTHALSKKNARTPNPLACSAQLKATSSPVPGDCYQVTFISSKMGQPLLSNDVTVFIPWGKTSGRRLANENQAPWVFPRQNQLGLGPATANVIPFAYHAAVQPALGMIDFCPLSGGCIPNAVDWSLAHPYGAEPSVANLLAALKTFTSAGPVDLGTSYLMLLQKRCFSASSPEPWCGYITSRRTRSSFQMVEEEPIGSGVGVAKPWDLTVDNPEKYIFFEPSTTGDGRLLMVNLNGFGLAYSYNPPSSSFAPCDIRGWETWYHVSHMPHDAQLDGVYPIATSMSQMGTFRYPNGAPIPDHTPLAIAYPWIDREGRNIFGALTNNGRDGYKAVEQHRGKPGADYNATNHPDYDMHRRPGAGGAGTGVFALGAWTEGQVVVLDNPLNFTDWGNHVQPATDPAGSSTIPPGDGSRRINEFDMQLYQGAVTRTRPLGSTFLFSIENQLNYYDALRPTLPFDVVWKVSANNGLQSEVAFDDYMHSRTVVVAHMNAAAVSATASGENGWLLTDGFEAGDDAKDVGAGERGFFHFKKSPRLQNASTKLSAHMRGPAYLMLRGGARVEPVAQGGVLGKGLFLDGMNDYLSMTSIRTTPRTDGRVSQDWYLGLWVDIRKSGTLYQFDDCTTSGKSYCSHVHLSPTRLYFRDTRAGSSSYVDLAALGLATGRYFHLGIKLHTNGNSRHATVYINGTYHKEIALLSTASFTIGQASQYGRLVLGMADRRATVPPLRGWVDEFRLVSLGDDEVPRDSYFQEIICNGALGTLVEVRPGDGASASPQLAALHAIATKSKLLGSGTKANVCEQLDYGSHDRPDLLPVQSPKVCANSAHRNPTSPDGDRCLRSSILRKPRQQQQPIPGLVHGAPRPDFTNVPFCLSCHHDETYVVVPGVAPLHPPTVTVLPDKPPTLGLDALRLRTGTPRRADPRRQPMDPPTLLYGRNPVVHQGVAPSGNPNGPIGQTSKPSPTGEVPSGVWHLPNNWDTDSPTLLDEHFDPPGRYLKP